MIPSAYVHIPFCRSICMYCAFYKTASPKLMEGWLEKVCEEIRTSLAAARRENPDFLLETIYFGGGTPTALSAGQLDRLCSCFDGYFAQDGEWTVEANPDSLDENKLTVLKSHGINRLSVGIQTFDGKRLALLGRRHDGPMAKEAIKLCKKTGFTNISADLMYGFDGQTAKDLQTDLEQFLKLDIDHLSIYSLILEPDSVLARRQVQPMDQEQCGLLYEQIEKVLEENGYVHYEVSSYARAGKFGKHNMKIWQDGLYFGFGCGAVGRNEKGLYHHSASLGGYVNGEDRIEYEPDENPWFDAIMTGLRTIWGVDLDAWNHKYQIDFKKRYRQVLDRYPDDLSIENGHLRCSRHGMEILDTILVDFLMED